MCSPICTDFVNFPETDQYSIQECQTQLELLSHSGFLLKKGFRFLKMWRYRKVELRQNILSYYDVSPPFDVHF